MKTLYSVLLLVCATVFIPALGLGLVAMYLLFTAPALFGIVFISGLTMFVSQSFAIAGGVAVAAFVGLCLIPKSKEESAPAVSVVTTAADATQSGVVSRIL